MWKRRHNAKARQVVKTNVDNRETNEIKLEFESNEYGNNDTSNILALPSKKRSSKVISEKKEKTRFLSKAQRKQLQKIVDKKKKKDNEEETHAHDFPTLAVSAPAIRSLIANEIVEELIEEVKKRPALYKKDLKQYSDIYVKKKLWEEVCAVVINNWSELNAYEKRENGREVQKKWNNLRTCFARELKAQKSVKSEQSALKRRPYVYFERMLFLVPCMESRPTEGSIETSESNQNDTDLSEEAQPHRQSKRKAKQGEFEEQLLNAPQSNEDADTNYCLSLVPFMKELTGDEKLEARIHILKMFQDIKKKRQFQNISFQPDTSQS